MIGNFYANNQSRIDWAEFWGTYSSGTGGSTWSAAITNFESYSVDFEYGVKNYTDSDFSFYSHTLAAGGTFYINAGAASVGEINKILLKGEVPSLGFGICSLQGVYKAWFHPNLNNKVFYAGGSELSYVDLWGSGEFNGNMLSSFDKILTPTRDLKIIRNFENFKIDNVTDMRYCFRDCNLYVNAPSWALLPAPAHLVGLTTDCFNGNPNIPNRASIHSDWISD